MSINIKVNNLIDGKPTDIILPEQTHNINIVEIINGKEDLSNCDGVFTDNSNKYKLCIKTADCAAIVFYDEDKYGIVHAGWRGLVGGIVEKMLYNFNNPYVYVAPFFKRFEIKKDFCYYDIEKKFGDEYFSDGDGKIIFDFKSALKSILPDNTVFDRRDTFYEKDFASWRRNPGIELRNYTVVWNE